MPSFSKSKRSTNDIFMSFMLSNIFCSSFVSEPSCVCCLRLFKIRFFNENDSPLKPDPIAQLKEKTKLNDEDLSFLFDQGTISNAAYIKTGQKIKLLRKNGEVINIEDATDLPNINAMSRIVSKNYICWANEVFL